MRSVFPNLRYVWLTRRDKVRQAVSYYRAIYTNQWWKTDVGPPNRENDIPERPPFDFAAIECLEKLLLNYEEQWQGYFTRSGIEPLVVTYEEMKEAYEPLVKQVLEFLEIPLPAKLEIFTPLLPQSDSVTEGWIEHYYALKRGRRTRLRWFVQTVSRPLMCSDAVQGASSAAGADEKCSSTCYSGSRIHFESALPAAIHRAATATSSAPIDSVVLNLKELRVAALQRSGHHAIINWLAAQCQGSVLFLNDAEPGTNPFLTCTITSRLDLHDAPKIPKGRLELFVKRGCLIHSYEDRSLEDIFSAQFEENHDAWVGATSKRHDIIVLRDPFNTFASRMSASWMRNKLDNEAGRAVTIDLWKSYAREFIGGSYYATHLPIFINYNAWFTNRSYRHELACALGLDFTDAGREVVAGRYGGSSFDGTRFHGQAYRMNVLERWMHFAESEQFRAIFEDKELLDMSNEIFGPVPGTKVFFS